MSVISNIKMNKAIKIYELVIAEDDKKRPVLYLGDEDKRVLLKRFTGKGYYKRFLAEAVIMRMCADKKSVSKCQEIYESLVKFLEDDNKDDPYYKI